MLSIMTPLPRKPCKSETKRLKDDPDRLGVFSVCYTQQEEPPAPYYDFNPFPQDEPEYPLTAPYDVYEETLRQGIPVFCMNIPVTIIQSRLDFLSFIFLQLNVFHYHISISNHYVKLSYQERY